MFRVYIPQYSLPIVDYAHFSNFREANHQLNIRVENTESKNLMVENEFRSSQTILLERANQISGLQRECDQKDMRIASFENILHVEKDAIGKLEVQLSVANEKVLGLQSEGAQLRQQVEFSQHRVEEKESSATQAQQRFDTMLQSMKEERDKVHVGCFFVGKILFVCFCVYIGKVFVVMLFWWCM